MPRRNGYSALQITLHWLIAVLIAAAWFTHEGMGRALEKRIETGASGIEGNTAHVWIGGAVFALILLHLIVRLIQGAPGPVPGSSPMIAAAALWGHRLLYLLMVVTPALGATAWYGGVEPAGEVHELFGFTLILVSLGHAVMALWHQNVWKDGTMTRMTKPQA
ncbi:cytochrome b [Ruegeria sediminis]|uniref:Cytochrome b n=1 Tax=Ruegeria sediminis TaxID=2583820 RepID=A0ABY2WY64_9RHOB|nr:cytochrome b/b6 domain-containing protein [Ruegeria sediminis]TMV07815.1 cytochrome b [Ruegeria sediminis]